MLAAQLCEHPDIVLLLLSDMALAGLYSGLESVCSVPLLPGQRCRMSLLQLLHSPPEVLPLLSELRLESLPKLLLRRPVVLLLLSQLCCVRPPQLLHRSSDMRLLKSQHLLMALGPCSGVLTVLPV